MTTSNSDYALFLGCTVPARSGNYELSARKVAERLGVKFADIEEFACCGFPLKSLNRTTSVALAARNLALATRCGMNICTLCSACTAILTETGVELDRDVGLKSEINSLLDPLGLSYDGRVKVKSFARFLWEEIGAEKLKRQVLRPLKGFKFAPHYGCHYLKPSEIYEGFDNPEVPVTLDRLIEVTGADSLDYEDKLECCGGSVLGVDQSVAYSMAKSKLDHVRAAGADAIVVVCPFCSVMYDDSQKSIESTFQQAYNIPVLFYPQLLGLAMGMAPNELGLQMNRVKTRALLERIEGVKR